MKRSVMVTCAGVALLGLGACVAGSAASQDAASGGLLQQFLLGLWHGMIAPVTLIVEIINKFAPHLLPWSVRLYESKNTGVVYDIGFYLGLGAGPPIVFKSWRRPR
ncbi:MAG: hypothetical protein ACXU82_11810 [Caulobacteraceae bacterium]